MITYFIRFAFISFLFSSAAVFSADKASLSTEPNASQVMSQNTLNTQLPEWFYRELTSIRKDVSVLDATGASKEQIQELKERIGTVEVRLEESQLRVEEKLNEQSGRIGDINASIDQFGILITVLGLVASAIAVLFGWISAGRKAKSEARRHVDDWLESNKKELDAQLVAAKEKLETTLEAEVNAAKKQIEELINGSKEKIETVESQVESLETSILKKLKLQLDGSEQPKISTGNIQKIEEQVQKILKKPINERNTLDWKHLAIKAYFDDDDFDKAVEYIDRALENEKALSDQDAIEAFVLKSICLKLLNRLKEEILVCNQIINRFKDSHEVYLQKEVQEALSRKAVLALATQDKEQVKKPIQDSITFIKDGYKDHRAAMELLNFIIEESTADEVFRRVEYISDGEGIEWGFNEIRPVIEKLESPRKEQAEAFVRFFEDHHDKAKLKEELAQIPNT